MLTRGVAGSAALDAANTNRLTSWEEIPNILERSLLEYMRIELSLCIPPAHNNNIIYQLLAGSRHFKHSHF